MSAFPMARLSRRPSLSPRYPVGSSPTTMPTRYAAMIVPMASIPKPRTSARNTTPTGM